VRQPPRRAIVRISHDLTSATATRDHASQGQAAIPLPGEEAPDVGVGYASVGDNPALPTKLGFGESQVFRYQPGWLSLFSRAVHVEAARPAALLFERGIADASMTTPPTRATPARG
jgi:hypothetical protein